MSISTRHSHVLSGRSDVVYVDPIFVPAYFSEIIVERYFQVAIAAVLIYDTLITLDKEVKYFWKVPKRAVDYVFFLNRYVGILGAIAFIFWDTYGPDLTLCNFADWAQNIANCVTIVSIDYILMVRVLALYSQEKRMSIFISILLFLAAAFKLGMAIYLGTLQKIVIAGLSEDLTVCGVTVSLPEGLGALDWSIPMTYGATLMMLALYKAAQYWSISTGFKGFMLVKILICDQAFYFMLVVVCCAFDIMGFMLRIPNEFVGNALNTLENPALLTILGSRMMFNLKEAGELGLNEGMSVRMPSRTVSDIMFAAPENPRRESATGIDENREA